MSASAKTGQEILRLEGVTKTFGQNLVLDRLSLSLAAGENLAILGRSGSGKSVLLKIIIGLLEPDSGVVSLWGQLTADLSEEDWVPLRRRMGFVFQSGALFDSMSVFDNVAFPLLERRIQSESEIQRIVAERLEWVGLKDAGRLSPSELSGGMRRRVALARTIAVNPEFLLYDEPTAGLDPLTGRKISRLMRDLDNKLKSTSILVTHDIECARMVSSRWAYLSNGKVLADGAPQEILSSQEPEIREFMLPPAEESIAHKAQDLPSSSRGP
jgi:phospholipid/cholesterol/gamma-HCH transport system ATP-binding protein